MRSRLPSSAPLLRIALAALLTGASAAACGHPGINTGSVGVGGCGSDGCCAGDCCADDCCGPDGCGISSVSTGVFSTSIVTGVGGSSSCAPQTATIDCDDQDPCTKDLCFGGACVHVGSQTCKGPGGFVYGDSFDDTNNLETGQISVAVDALGNAVFAGTFSGELQIGGQMLSSGGAPSAVFVVKLDPQGKPLWSHGYTCFSGVAPISVAFDPQGDVVMAGAFRGGSNGIDLGGGAIGADPANQQAIFVAALDAAGEYLWSEAFTQNSNVETQSLAVAPDGTIALAGVMIQTINLGGGLFLGPLDGDLFVAELDATGKPLWTRSIKDNSFPMTPSTPKIAFDAQSQLVVAGSFIGPTDLGGAIPGNFGEEWSFVAAYDAKGQLTATKLFPDSNGAALTQGLAIAPGSGDWIISGVFNGQMTAGGLKLSSSKDVSRHDGFVIRLDPTGQLLWAKAIASPTDTPMVTVAADGGEVLLTGAFAGALDLGSGAVQTTGDADYDAFVAKLDTGGNVLWRSRFGSIDAQVGTVIAADAMGDVFVGGVYQTSIDLGGGSLVTSVPHDIGLFAGHFLP